METPEHDYQHANAWTYFNLIDARNAAKNYLLQAKEAFPEEKKNIVQDLYHQYEMIYNELKKNWVYFPMTDWIHADKNEIWSPTGTMEGSKWTDEMRLKGAQGLERVKEMEIRAYQMMEELII